MCSGEASVGERMKRAGWRKPSLSESKRARPGDRAFLTSATQGAPPERYHSVSQDTQAGKVSRYRVLVEVALYDRPEPFSGLGHGIVHALTELLPNLSQLPSQALADGLAPYHESPQAILPADMRES